MVATMTATRERMKSRNWRALDHYLLSGYASIEEWQQRIVIVDPALSEVTWLLRAGTRKVKRSNVLALIVPTLAALTYDLAVAHTNVATDYQGLREWPLERRSCGDMNPHGLPLIADKITESGPVMRTGAPARSTAA